MTGLRDSGNLPRTTLLVQSTIDGTSRVIGATGKPLTVKQERVFGLVQTTPGGVTADEVGAQLHADLGRHPADQRCEWDARDGLSVLRSKAVGPLVVRRRVSGRWELRDGTTPPVHASGQMRELPGESFEDMFGDAA